MMIKAALTELKPSALFHVARPKFLTASAAPVLVGTALGYAVAGTFDPVLFLLALPAIMALQAGANITNDYFDHLSRNDWVNEHPTPFSGGSRFIQKELLSPDATLLAGLLYLAAGAGLGLITVALTQSPFILVLGLMGLLGGYFYTARPIQLGYRGVGEVVIGFLFGVLPVYGAYYLQTASAGPLPLLPALIVSILVFLIILVNEFPDRPADAAVSKRTLVVVFGVPACTWVYRISLGVSVALAAGMLLFRPLLLAGLFYLLTAPLAVTAIRSANKKDLSQPGYFVASQNTVIMHTIGCLALTAGLVIGRLTGLAG